MKHTFSKCFSILFLVSTCASLLADSSNRVAPYYSIRSQSVNAARELVGWTDHINKFDMEKFYGSFSATFEYSQSFRNKRISRCLFGSSLTDCGDCGEAIRVSGTRTAPRGECDWLADYFYLPTDFKSTLNFDPKIRNFLVDFNLYLGLDEWVKGMYIRVHAPVVHTKWDLNFCESKATGTDGHDAGYFNCSGTNLLEAIPRSALLNNFSEYACGQAPKPFPIDATTPATGSLTFQPLCFAKIKNCDQTETALADLRFAWGWNFVRDEDYHFGLNVRFAAPTGNRPKGEFLFEPIVGNGNHWELGGGLTSHFSLWRSEDQESSFEFFLDANVTHLFKTRHTRTFDLCGKPMSRYMLAIGMTTDVGDLTAGASSSTATPPTHVFNNTFAPVANLTTFDVDVSVGAQGDVVAMFNYTRKNFGWDFGYEFWGRSCEKFDCDTCEPCPPCSAGKCGPSLLSTKTQWALKGDAHVYGGEALNCVPLSATQSLATINAGRNIAAVGITPEDDAARKAAAVNPKVDNPQQAFNNGNAVFTSIAPFITPMNTSKEPVLLCKDSVDFVGTKGISHKIFTHLGYNWMDKEDWIPFIGVGVSVEFGSGRSSCNDKCDPCPSTSSGCDTVCDTSCDTKCDTKCDSCIKCSVSQWGVWVKGGISY